MKLRTQQEKKHLTKTLMYQRLVHYINLSLCKETYSPLEAVDKFKIIKSEIKKTEKKKITVWKFQNKNRSTTVR